MMKNSKYQFFFNCWFIIGLTVGIINSYNAEAQLSEKGLPESFLLDQKKAVIIPILRLDSVGVQKMIANDKKFHIDNRYGVVQQYEINIKKAGVRTEIKNKGIIWQYKIESHDAYSLGVFFKSYHLPKNAKVYIYDSSKTRLRGAFTQKNNNSDRQLPIAEFPEKNMIIEYFEPFSAEFSGELVIGAVSQAYINFQSLADDRIGINCPEGDEWQVEKHAVCLMTFHDFRNSYFCTGTLINNVKNDETPYFLTANHCVSSESIANTLVTYFNYENSTCTSNDASFSQTISGATFKSGSSDSDFSLLLLNEYPPDEYNPFYAGWDVTGQNPRSGACMHHPEGVSKCIALANNTAFSYPDKIEWYSEERRLISTTMPDTHWNVQFVDGRPEAGSSGGPLFDQNKRIVGQLHGGVNSVLLFGKISLSWNKNPSANEQLAHWLDPLNTTKILDGIWKLPPKTNFRTELKEVCVNTPILFTDKTEHKPTEWQWQIKPSSFSYTNGTDSTSQNPQILFHDDGLYSVELNTSNKYGSDGLIQNKYILAKSKLDVKFLKTRRDSVVCGCDLKLFQLIADGAVDYSYKVEKADLIRTKISSNNLYLTINPDANVTKSFDSWVKVTGTNGNCIASDSILLHVFFQPNDYIVNSTRLFLGHNSGFSNKCATVEKYEPFPSETTCTDNVGWCPDYGVSKNLLNNSIWFTFISPSNGKITINTNGFNDQIAVYKAPTYSSILSGDKRLFKMVAANDDRSISDKTSALENLILDPEAQYWLQVDGNNGDFGNITIDLLSNSLQAVIFPNPSSGIFNLNLSSPDQGIADVSITDLYGRKMLSKQYQVSLNSTQFNFDLTGYPKGIYVFSVHLNGASISKKLRLF